MRAAVLDVPGQVHVRPLVVREVPDPRPAPDELVLAVAACAVCRTDLQIAEGDLVARRLPIVPGHQVVGRVDTVGSAVTGWSGGDRAGVTWLAGSCGSCSFCRSGRENLCEDARFTGWDRDGGFAERIAVRGDVAVRIPDDFGDVEAAPLLCGGVVGYRALRLAGLGPDASGVRLGLYGFGASALLCLQVARWWGAEVHVATRTPRERDRALRLGAASVGGYDDPPPAQLDAAVTFAPSGDVVVAALRAVDRGASVVVNAIHLDRIPEFPYELLWWERSLRSIANVTRRDATEFLAAAAAIPIHTETRPFPLAEANEALVGLAEGSLTATAVIVP